MPVGLAVGLPALIIVVFLGYAMSRPAWQEIH